MNTNIITYKIPYFLANLQEEVLVSLFLKLYNSLFRYTYNRLLENPNLKTKEITVLQKLMKNVELMDLRFMTGAVYDAKITISNSEGKKIIFGGKSNFLKRCQGKLKKEEFKDLRIRPLLIVGVAAEHGNGKFQILTNSLILFKPNKSTHTCLQLTSVGKKRQKELDKLIELLNNCQLPITYKLDKLFIYITFDYNYVKQNTYTVKENRVLGIDINPNYLGYSIVDWKSETNYHIIDKGVISLKPLNDKQNQLKVSSTDKQIKYLNNKRDYEIIQIAYRLSELAKHYHCELFSMEDLSIKSKDLDRGRKINRLVNNYWCRNKLVNAIKKLISCSSTKLLEVEPSFSSFIGNLVYRQELLPDPCLASIEISRRCYEYNLQYIKKNKQILKNIIFPKLDLVIFRVKLSMEELNYFETYEDLRDLYYKIKNSKLRYRVSLDLLDLSRVFSKKYSKKKIILYNFT